MQAVDLFVPGRVCVIGEHSDWAGGFRTANPSIHQGQCLVYGTDVGITATATKSSADGVGSLTFREPDALEGRRLQVPWDRAELQRIAAEGGFFSYVCGSALVTAERLGWEAVQHCNVAFDIQRMTLPLGKGLSSSAAVCVLVARGLGQLFGHSFSTADEMELAYQGERLTPSLCGRMDQCCAFGSQFVAMYFDGDTVTTEAVVCKGTFHFVIADLRAKKNTQVILARLEEAYPRAETDLHRGVQEFLGPISFGCAEAAKQALAAGDAAGLGKLLTETQRLFDAHLTPACPEELTSPRLHEILSHPAVTQHTLGGKGVGSQGDGSVQFLCRDAESQRSTVHALEELGCQAFPFTIGAP